MSSSIKNIADTAYLVAVYRALETERPDAHFQDPLARLLAGDRGDELAQMLGSQQDAANTFAVRTKIIDELILQLIEVEGIDTVLNLGAGLDTRPYRLPLPPSVRWIEVDFPDVLSYKEHKLKGKQPKCSLELVKLDLNDLALRNALFSKVNEGNQVLVIAEGVLTYLHSGQVAALAADIHQQPNFRWWLFELLSPLVLQQSQKRFDKYFAAGNATLQFAPEEGAKFFRQYGWHVAQFRSVWEEARRLKRELPLTWLLQLLIPLVAKERWETFSQRDGVVLLERF